MENKSKSGTAGPCCATYTIVELGKLPLVTALFAGRSRVPPAGTAGYVRSQRRARLADPVRAEEAKRTQSLAWRDYPDEMLTPVETVLAQLPADRDHLLISARNTLNELGYQVRLGGKWWRRKGDQLVPGPWPILALGAQGMRLLKQGAANGLPDDLVTGLPLVIDGEAMRRPFFLRHCSDLAHVFELDPQGRLGPCESVDQSERRRENARLWQTFSDAWQDLWDRGLNEAAFSATLEALASEHGVRETQHLLHSLVAQRFDGSVLLFALSGALHHISEHLVDGFSVQHAVLLDNSGSVGWLSRLAGASQATCLVAGPNYRPRGTVFLDVQLPGFIRPRAHPSLGWPTSCDAAR